MRELRDVSYDAHSIQKLLEFVRSIQIKPTSVEGCLRSGLLSVCGKVETIILITTAG